jgi:hypothetical protein
VAVRTELGALLLLVGLVAVGCVGDSDSSAETTVRAETIATDPFGPAPTTPKGPLDEQLPADINLVSLAASSWTSWSEASSS